MTIHTVIHVWTNNCCNIQYNPNDTSSYWGLGDLLRGTIKLYQLQKYLKFNLIVDFSLHPISEFMENPPHNYNDIIKTNLHNIPYYYIDNLKPYLKEELQNSSSCNDNTEKIILLTTNDKVIETMPITEQCKTFIKDILKPKLEFQEYITNFINNLIIKDFNILHIRLGDDTLVKNNIISNYEEIIKQLIATNILDSKTDLILTDNYNLKQYILQYRKDLYTLDTNIAHTGMNTESQKIKDTLLEFFLLRHAKEIKTLSIYNWISGFVLWIAKIYDIPILSIKLKNK